MLKSESVQLVFYSSYSSSKVQVSSWCSEHSMQVQLQWLLDHILQMLSILKLWVCKILEKSSFRAHTQIQKWSIYCNCFWISDSNREKNNEKHVQQCFLCLEVENHWYHIQNCCHRHVLCFQICMLNLQIQIHEFSQHCQNSEQQRHNFKHKFKLNIICFQIYSINQRRICQIIKKMRFRVWCFLTLNVSDV